MVCYKVDGNKIYPYNIYKYIIQVHIAYKLKGLPAYVIEYDPEELRSF